MLEVNLTGIKDFATRDAIANVQDEFRDNDLLGGKFTFFTLSFLSAVTNYKFPHGLGFKPLDIIQTSFIGLGTGGAGAVEFNYSLFDAVNLDITTTDACRFRFFAGSFVPNSRV